MSVVTVLTPHGRRQTVRCEPNQACMHILDEVCRKFTEFRSADYELCHHRRVLDLTQMFRFAGLPNNAQLEMQAATRQRSADRDVTLQLQLVASGRRVQADFAPDTTVLEIVRQLGGDEVLVTAGGGAVRADTVCVYMRTELWGDRLATTTLRSLGLTGGRAAIRVMHKDPGTLGVQANVSAPLVAAVAPAAVPLVAPVRMVEETEEPLALSVTPANDNPQPQQPHTSSDAMDTDTAAVPKSQSPSPVDCKKLKMDDDEPVANDAAVANTSLAAAEPPPSVHIIGPRSACVYSLDEAARLRDAQQLLHASSSDDRFYEVSVTDLKVLLRDLRCQTRGQDDQPLLTAKMRELDEAQRTLQRLARYRRTVIRVQFPDRLVLQGTFAAVDRVRDVHEWVRGFLVDEHADAGFELFTTPPKQTPDADETLVEANCVPAAVLHFGTRSTVAELAVTTVLKNEYVAQLSSPEAAVLEASKYRGLSNSGEDDPNGDEEGAVGGAATATKGPPENRRQQHGSQFKGSAAQSTVGAEAKLPKWFKPIGK